MLRQARLGIFLLMCICSIGTAKAPPAFDLGIASDAMTRAGSPYTVSMEDLSDYFFKAGALTCKATKPKAVERMIQGQCIQVLPNRFDSGFEQVLVPQFTFVNIDPLYSRPYTQAPMPPVMVNPTWHFVNKKPLVSQVLDNMFAFEGALYGAERDVGVLKDANTRPRTHLGDDRDVSEYCPHILWHVDEDFIIEKYGWYVLPAAEAIKHGLGRGLTSTDCSAICYWFQWNGETDYNFQGLDKKPDKEPVVIYVSESGEVLGMQTRVHNQWQDMKPVGKDDLFDGKHVVVFFGNIFYELLGERSLDMPVFTHTPILGHKAVECVKMLANSRKAYEMGTDYKGKLQLVTMVDFPLKASPLSDNKNYFPSDKLSKRRFFCLTGVLPGRVFTKIAGRSVRTETRFIANDPRIFVKFLCSVPSAFIT